MKALIFSDLAAGILETLGGRFPGVAFHPCTSYAALGPALAQLQPEIVVAGRFEAAPFPRDMLLTCPSLRWLSLTSAGVDHVVPFDAGRITVTNAAGVAAEEMAQYVIAAIFGLYQGFPRFARQQDAQLWKFDLIRSARGASVGIVGLGRTGAAIARLCKAVGLRVLACRSRPLPSPHVDQLYATADLKEMLAACDVTVLCAALTPETRDMFDAETFASLRPGSYFINVGRGALVDEDALVAALESGRLAGGFIDVARSEPLPAGHKLWTAPNLFITPHTCSEFLGWERRAAEMFADNLTRYLSGQTLENVVSSERGY